MKKIFLFLFLAFTIGAGAFFLLQGRGESSGGLPGAFAENGAGDSEPIPGAAGLPKVMNMEGLELSQGEGGKVLWTLHAEQAEMQEEGGVIYASDPFLTYYLRSRDTEASDASAGAAEPEVLTVKSLNGDVDQQTHDMRFIKDVVVLNADKRMTSDELAYSGAEKTLTSPGKTFFDSPNMDGNSGKATWDLNTNMLFASGGVTVNWETVQSEK